MNYKIVLTGKLLDDTSLEGAIESLATMFRIPSEKAEKTFARAPITIKKSVDEATGKKYKMALAKKGIECTLEVLEQRVLAEDVVQPDTSVTASVQNEQLVEGVATDSPISSVAAVSPENTANSQHEEFKHDNADPLLGYQFQFEGRPDYGFVTVKIPADETLKVEASAMATMDTNIKMKTKLGGGFSRFLTGESLFINEYTAEGGQGEVGIAPASPGDIGHMFLNDETIYLQNSAYVASTAGVE
ncbi:MAG: AIM24 family protein, partial [Kangiellaceae bacterium]|nr:AIM24 family protein [Kangiellaceae bacterium]